MLLAPDDCPEDLTKALSEKAAKIDRFCDRALLFQAEYEGGEASLMVCFTDVEDGAKARIEGAVADALMASGHEGHALGVLFLAAGNPSLAHIEKHARRHRRRQRFARKVRIVLDLNKISPELDAIPSLTKR